MLSIGRERYYRGVFGVGAVYDIGLGLAFLFLPRQSFELVGAANAFPEFTAYVTLIAAFLLVIGVGYVLLVRGDLVRNRDLIAVGVLYKLAYTAVALFYLMTGDYPHISFVAVFGGADFVFLVLMAECWWYVTRVDAQVRGG